MERMRPRMNTLFCKGKTDYLGSYAGKQEARKTRERGEETHNDFLEWRRGNHSGSDLSPQAGITRVRRWSNERQ